jgi:hypothetical protein
MPDLRLVRTCESNPEQYDVFAGDEQIGYLRLRHGWFEARRPNGDGNVVYEAAPDGDGCFMDYERDRYLNEALSALSWWAGLSKAASPAHPPEPAADHPPGTDQARDP